MAKSKKRQKAPTGNNSSKAFPAAKMKKHVNPATDDCTMDQDKEANEISAEDCNQTNRNNVAENTLSNVADSSGNIYINRLKSTQRVLNRLCSDTFCLELAEDLSKIVSAATLQHIDIKTFMDACFMPVEIKDCEISDKDEKLDLISNVYILWKAAGFQPNMLNAFFERHYFEHVLFPQFDIFDENYLNIAIIYENLKASKRSDVYRKQKYIHHLLSMMVYFCYIMEKKGKHSNYILSFFNECEAYRKIFDMEKKNYDTTSTVLRDTQEMMKLFVLLKMQILTANILLLLNANFGFGKYLPFMIHVSHKETGDKYMKMMEKYIKNRMKKMNSNVNTCKKKRKVSTTEKEINFKNINWEHKKWKFLLLNKNQLYRMDFAEMTLGIQFIINMLSNPDEDVYGDIWKKMFDPLIWNHVNYSHIMDFLKENKLNFKKNVWKQYRKYYNYFYKYKKINEFNILENNKFCTVNFKVEAEKNDEFPQLFTESIRLKNILNIFEEKLQINCYYFFYYTINFFILVLMHLEGNQKLQENDFIESNFSCEKKIWLWYVQRYLFAKVLDVNKDFRNWKDFMNEINALFKTNLDHENAWNSDSCFSDEILRGDVIYKQRQKRKTKIVRTKIKKRIRRKYVDLFYKDETNTNEDIDNRDLYCEPIIKCTYLNQCEDGCTAHDPKQNYEYFDTKDEINQKNVLVYFMQKIGVGKDEGEMKIVKKMLDDNLLPGIMKERISQNDDIQLGNPNDNQIENANIGQTMNDDIHKLKDVNASQNEQANICNSENYSVSQTRNTDTIQTGSVTSRRRNTTHDSRRGTATVGQTANTGVSQDRKTVVLKNENNNVVKNENASDVNSDNDSVVIIDDTSVVNSDNASVVIIDNDNVAKNKNIGASRVGDRIADQTESKDNVRRKGTPVNQKRTFDISENEHSISNQVSVEDDPNSFVSLMRKYLTARIDGDKIDKNDLKTCSGIDKTYYKKRKEIDVEYKIEFIYKCLELFIDCLSTPIYRKTTYILINYFNVLTYCQISVLNKQRKFREFVKRLQYYLIMPYKSNVKKQSKRNIYNNYTIYMKRLFYFTHLCARYIPYFKDDAIRFFFAHLEKPSTKSVMLRFLENLNTNDIIMLCQRMRFVPHNIMKETYRYKKIEKLIEEDDILQKIMNDEKKLVAYYGIPRIMKHVKKENEYKFNSYVASEPLRSVFTNNRNFTLEDCIDIESSVKNTYEVLGDIYVEIFWNKPEIVKECEKLCRNTLVEALPIPWKKRRLFYVLILLNKLLPPESPYDIINEKGSLPTEKDIFENILLDESSQLNFVKTAMFYSLPTFKINLCFLNYVDYLYRMYELYKSFCYAEMKHLIISAMLFAEPYNNKLESVTSTIAEIFKVKLLCRPMSAEESVMLRSIQSNIDRNNENVTYEIKDGAHMLVDILDVNTKYKNFLYKSGFDLLSFANCAPRQWDGPKLNAFIKTQIDTIDDDPNARGILQGQVHMCEPRMFVIQDMILDKACWQKTIDVISKKRNTSFKQDGRYIAYVSELCIQKNLVKSGKVEAILHIDIRSVKDADQKMEWTYLNKGDLLLLLNVRNHTTEYEWSRINVDDNTLRKLFGIQYVRCCIVEKIVECVYTSLNKSRNENGKGKNKKNKKNKTVKEIKDFDPESEVVTVIVSVLLDHAQYVKDISQNEDIYNSFNIVLKKRNYGHSMFNVLQNMRKEVVKAIESRFTDVWPLQELFGVPHTHIKYYKFFEVRSEENVSENKSPPSQDMITNSKGKLSQQESSVVTDRMTKMRITNTKDLPDWKLYEHNDRKIVTFYKDMYRKWVLRAGNTLNRAMYYNMMEGTVYDGIYENILHLLKTTQACYTCIELRDITNVEIKNIQKVLRAPVSSFVLSYVPVLSRKKKNSLRPSVVKSNVLKSLFHQMAYHSGDFVGEDKLYIRGFNCVKEVIVFHDFIIFIYYETNKKHPYLIAFRNYFVEAEKRKRRKNTMDAKEPNIENIESDESNDDESDEDTAEKDVLNLEMNTEHLQLLQSKKEALLYCTDISIKKTNRWCEELEQKQKQESDKIEPIVLKDRLGCPNISELSSALKLSEYESRPWKKCVQNICESLVTEKYSDNSSSDSYGVNENSSRGTCNEKSNNVNNLLSSNVCSSSSKESTPQQNNTFHKTGKCFTDPLVIRELWHANMNYMTSTLLLHNKLYKFNSEFYEDSVYPLEGLYACGYFEETVENDISEKKNAVIQKNKRGKHKDQGITNDKTQKIMNILDKALTELRKQMMTGSVVAPEVEILKYLTRKEDMQEEENETDDKERNCDDSSDKDKNYNNKSTDSKLEWSRKRIVWTARQLEGIKSCLHDTLTIIDGIPGSGKTTLLKKVVDILYRNDRHNKILVCVNEKENENTFFEELINEWIEDVNVDMTDITNENPARKTDKEAFNSNVAAPKNSERSKNATSLCDDDASKGGNQLDDENNSRSNNLATDVHNNGSNSVNNNVGMEESEELNPKEIGIETFMYFQGIHHIGKLENTEAIFYENILPILERYFFCIDKSLTFEDPIMFFRLCHTDYFTKKELYNMCLMPINVLTKYKEKLYGNKNVLDYVTFMRTDPNKSPIVIKLKRKDKDRFCLVDPCVQFNVYKLNVLRILYPFKQFHMYYNEVRCFERNKMIGINVSRSRYEKQCININEEVNKLAVFSNSSGSKNIDISKNRNRNYEESACTSANTNRRLEFNCQEEGRLLKGLKKYQEYAVEEYKKFSRGNLVSKENYLKSIHMLAHIYMRRKQSRQQLQKDILVSWKLNEVFSLFTHGKLMNIIEKLKREFFKKIYLKYLASRIMIIRPVDILRYSNEILYRFSDFKYVIIDDCSQIMECSLAMVIFMHSLIHKKKQMQQLVLVGDSKQLMPFINSRALKCYANLEQSLFRRLLRLRIPHIFLNRQGRMRSSLCDITRFYYLSDHTNINPKPLKRHKEEKFYDRDFNPGFLHTHQFIDVCGYELEVQSGYYVNIIEAQCVMKLFKYMISLGYPSKSITILTPYRGQVDGILNLLKVESEVEQMLEYPECVTTIDEYRGKQNDYIIISLVRTSYNVGFLNEANRIITAFSRARLGLYVLGALEVFKECDVFLPALSFFPVDGTIMTVQKESYKTMHRI